MRKFKKIISIIMVLCMAVSLPATAFAENLQDTALSIKEIVKITADSVVEITTESVQTSSFMQQYITNGAGSGVIMTSDGYIVTNNHVINGAGKIVIKLRNGTVYDGTLVGSDSKTDLAIVKINATGLTVATPGSSAALEVGDTAVAIGNPLGSLGGTVTTGIISALSREIQIGSKTMTLLQTNAAINPGNSGGGLFNDRGQLVGIVTAKSEGVGIEGLGFAIPIDTAKNVIDQLIEKGYVSGRVEVGLNLLDISNIQLAMQYGVYRTGVYVQSVVENSGAAAAGIIAGDRIVGLNGEAITSVADINRLLDKASVGDAVKFIIARGNQIKEISVVLGEYKPRNS